VSDTAAHEPEDDSLQVVDGHGRKIAFPDPGSIAQIATGRCINCGWQVIGIGVGHWVHADDGMEPCRLPRNS
jgi:hypothetical protein